MPTTSNLWLADADALKNWLDSAPPQVPVALDTEFERTDTFFPKPGLVQLAREGDARLVEPSVAEACPAFSQWLSQAPRPKLLYAMSEDLDLFRHWLGCEVQGALDLQLGAALAGFGYAVGYANLVETVLQKNLDKSQTRSDWLHRPLSAEQEQYALDDVRYLHPLYAVIQSRLQSKGLAGALEEESAQVALDWQRQAQPESYFSRLRGGWRLKRSQQAVLQRLATWREQECRRRNRPRHRILSDKALLEVAEVCPSHVQQLASLAEVPPVVVRRYGDQLLAEVGAAERLPDSDLIPKPLGREQQPLYRSVKTIVDEVAEQNEVPPALMASRKRLEQWVREGLAAGGLPDVMMQGWRGELLALRQSELEDLFADAQP